MREKVTIDSVYILSVIGLIALSFYFDYIVMTSPERLYSWAFKFPDELIFLRNPAFILQSVAIVVLCIAAFDIGKKKYIPYIVAIPFVIFLLEIIIQNKMMV